MKNIKWDKISSLAGIASSLATMVALLYQDFQEIYQALVLFRKKQKHSESKQTSPGWR